MRDVEDSGEEANSCDDYHEHTREFGDEKCLRVILQQLTRLEVSSCLERVVDYDVEEVEDSKVIRLNDWRSERVQHSDLLAAIAAATVFLSEEEGGIAEIKELLLKG